MPGNQVLYSATTPLEGAATRAKFEKDKEERGLVPYFVRLVTATQTPPMIAVLTALWSACLSLRDFTIAHFHEEGGI